MVHLGVTVRKVSNHPLPRCRIGRARNPRAPLREPLLLLELHPLPRRIPQHAVESANAPTLTAPLEHLRKRQMPVKNWYSPASRSTSRRCAGTSASGSTSNPRTVSVVMQSAGSRPAAGPAPTPTPFA